VEALIEAWSQLLQNPNVKFRSRYRQLGVLERYKEEEEEDEEEQEEEQIVVTIKAEPMDFSSRLVLPDEIEVFSPNAMRAVVQLLVDDLTSRANELRDELREGNIEL
jgi:hypothetical protein